MNTRAFTIVELLIVVVVIAILASVTIVSYNGISSRADAAVRRTEANQMKEQILTYKVLNNTLPGQSYLDNCPVTTPQDCYYIGVNASNATPMADSSTYSGTHAKGTVSTSTFKSLGVDLPDNSGFYSMRYYDAKLSFVVVVYRDPKLIPAEGKIAKDTDPVFPVATPFTTYITSASNKARVIQTPTSLTCSDGSAITATYGSNVWNSSSTSVTNMIAPAGSGGVTGNGLYVRAKAFSCNGTQVGLIVGVVDVYGENRAAFVIEN